MPRKRQNGEGFIKKRNVKRKDGSTYVRYAAVVTIGWTPEGKQDQEEGPWRKKSSEASLDLAEMRKKRDAGVLSADTPYLGAYLDYWLEQRAPHLQPKSLRGYSDDIARYLKPTLGDIRLDRLKPTDLQSWQTKLLSEHSPYVVRRAQAALSAALRQAVRWGRLDRPLADMLPPVPMPQIEYTIWEKADSRRFLKAAQDHPYYALFYLTLNTGLRIGEVRGLRWQDVEPGAIWVRQQCQGYASKAIFKKPKTKQSYRRIPIPPDVTEVLEARRAAQDADRLRVGAAYTDLDLVFTTSLGTPIGADKIYDAQTSLTNKARDAYAQLLHKTCQGPALERALRELEQEEKLPHIRFHDLRHTHASMMIAPPFLMPAHELAARLGHADPSMTMRIYVHLFKQHQDRYAIPMAELLAD